MLLAFAILSCATEDGGPPMRTALANAVAAEQLAWIHDGTRPSGLESMTALTTINARVDRVTFLSSSEVTVLATYKYTGRFADGHEGTLTLQRNMQFTKTGSDWLQTPQRAVVESSH